MMDYKDPEKVLEICAMATKGPWEHQHEHYGESVTSDGGSNVVCFPYAFADAQFIALARAALPYWVEKARQLEAVAAAARKVAPVKFCQITYEDQENIIALEDALAALEGGAE